MDSSIIIILVSVLIILAILNYFKISNITTGSTSTAASCSQTTFGCCPNGVDSKINYYGTNCPGYVPPPPHPIYYPSYPPPPPPQPVVPPPRPILPPPPQPVPPPPHPIYPVNPIQPIRPRPLPGPIPGPMRLQPIGGCAGTQYGCCPDNLTAKIDSQGSNCLLK